MDDVSWDEAITFVVKLNALNDGYVYRLPSEAEWEYAARAGTTGDYAGDLDSMGRVARGGSWWVVADQCRSSYRMLSAPDYRNVTTGLRVVAVAQ